MRATQREHQMKPIQLTQDDIETANALIRAIKTRMELLEKLLNENTKKECSVVLGSFGE